MEEKRRIDKIFDNTYESKEIESSLLKFKIESSFGITRDLDDEVHLNLLYNDINDVIIISEYNRFNVRNDKGKIIKLNKAQINQVYGFILNNMKNKYRRIEIWSMLAEYFDICPTKFFNSLSNNHKHELLLDLDSKNSGISIKKIF
jgi:predicted nucleic acid-binding protein